MQTRRIFRKRCSTRPVRRPKDKRRKIGSVESAALMLRWILHGCDTMESDFGLWEFDANQKDRLKFFISKAIDELERKRFIWKGNNLEDCMHTAFETLDAVRKWIIDEMRDCHKLNEVQRKIFEKHRKEYDEIVSELSSLSHKSLHLANKFFNAYDGSKGFYECLEVRNSVKKKTGMDPADAFVQKRSV